MSIVGFANDLDLLVKDFGVPVTWTGAPVGLKGIVDVAGLDVLPMARVSATERSVLVKTSALVSFSGIDGALTVDGVSYVARDVTLATPDGAYSVIALKAVPTS